MKKARAYCAVLAILFVLPVLLFLASCQNEKPSDNPPAKEPSLSLNHTQLTLYTGDTIKLLPKLVGIEETSLIFNSSLSSVATVDSEGSVMAISEGSTVITCRTADDSLSAFCTVIVKSKNAGSNDTEITPSLVLDTTAITLSIGETRKLVPTLTLPEGVERTLTYTSTAPVIATVDNTGTITAVAAGTVSIVVKGAQGLQATCLVTVNGNGGRHVELDFTSATLEVGSTRQLNATYTTAISGDKTDLIYSSSLPSVADVDKNGIITANATGTAIITVSNFNGTANATCTITVVKRPAATLTLDKEQLSLQVDDTATIKATYIPVNETDSKILTYSSSLPAIATVDQNGKITAKAVGSAVISVSNADGTVKATCTVTVKEKSKASLTLDKTSLTLDEGSTFTLHPTYIPAKPTDSTVLTFSTSNSSVVKVDNSGKITAVAAGSANIIVKNKEGTIQVSCHVTVVANTGKEASLTLDIYTLSLVTGESKTLRTSYTPASENDSKKLIFTSSAPNIVSVDAIGNIIAKTAGSATITVTNETESVKATCVVTVKPAPVKPTDITKIGSFKTNTGTNLNLLVEWTLSQDEYSRDYRLTANVYLESYSIICGKRTGSSFLTIDGHRFAFNTEALNYPGVKEKQKIFFATASVVYKEDELPETVTIDAIWTFNGSYSGVSIPVLHPQAEVHLK